MSATLVHAAPAMPAAVSPEAWLDEPRQLARFTRWHEGATGARAESALRLSGLHCALCGQRIEQALRHVDGVESVVVQAASSRASVVWDPSRTRAAALVEAVQAAGYGAEPDTAAGARALRRAESRQAMWRLFVASFCAMQVMMLAAPAYVAGPGGIEPDLKRLLDWGAWVMTLPVLLFSAAPFFRGAWAALRERRVGMDVTVALGLAVGFVASSVAMVDPTGPLGADLWFDSLSMFVALLLGARWLELRARHRAAASFEGALDALPETAERLRSDGSGERVGIAQLRPGDRVRVAAGQGFPADGCLIEGSTAADESLLTGESRPQRKACGDAVAAASVNLDAPVVMRVERAGPGTRHDAIVELMREAQSQRPASARWAERWAAPFLVTVLVLAAGAAIAWSFIDPSRAVGVAVAVLIVTCPCALSLATPSALLVAADALARRGVLLRRLDALEAMARCTAVFVDKTGTLTEDRLRFAAAELLPLRRESVRSAQARGAAARADERDALIDRAAALAAWSRHPVARALAEAYPGGRFGWQNVQELPGLGLEAEDGFGGLWRLGRPDWVGAQHGEPSPAAPARATGHVDVDKDDLPSCDPPSQIAGWGDTEAPAAHGPEEDRAADASGLLATFGPVGLPRLRLVFDEALRPGAVDALDRLAERGLKLALLSGDAPARVAHLARALPFDAVHGGVDPAGKLAALRAAQAGGATVAMLGDGLNDAPVLAQADVSIALGAGALLARSQADAVLLADRIEGVAALHAMSVRCMRVVRQNIAWAAAYNLACVPLALAGLLPPWAAGLGMAASSLVVAGNALRLAR